MEEKKKNNCVTSVYSRITGYFQPVQTWNKGKVAEFHERKTYKLKEDDGKAKEQKDEA